MKKCKMCGRNDLNFLNMINKYAKKSDRYSHCKVQKIAIWKLQKNKLSLSEGLDKRVAYG
jgi:hypothetical protein